MTPDILDVVSSLLESPVISQGPTGLLIEGLCNAIIGSSLLNSSMALYLKEIGN